MTAATNAVEALFAHPLRFLASFLPVVLSLLLVVLANLPVSFTGGLFPAPALALSAVFFWALVRPDLMTPVAVLCIGLSEDLLSGGPPGLWAAGFLAAYAFVDRQRETLAGLSGFGALLGFAGAVILAAASSYALACLVYLRWAPAAPLLLESVGTVLFYPLTAWPMSWLHRRVVGAMQRDEPGVGGQWR